MSVTPAHTTVAKVKTPSCQSTCNHQQTSVETATSDAVRTGASEIIQIRRNPRAQPKTSPGSKRTAVATPKPGTAASQEFKDSPSSSSVFPKFLHSALKPSIAYIA